MPREAHLPSLSALLCSLTDKTAVNGISNHAEGIKGICAEGEVHLHEFMGTNYKIQNSEESTDFCVISQLEGMGF